MKINHINKINPQYSINKAQIQSAIHRETVKQDGKYQNRLYPLISVDLCDNLILQNVLLNKSIITLSKDIILNDFTYLEENTEINKQQVETFWENNKNELYQQIIDYYSYGFGASEIVFNNQGEPVKLYQIPANTLYIKQELNRDGSISYYAVQQVTGRPDVKMRLSHFNYTDEDNELPVCLWIGGGRQNDFFDYPIWISAFNYISASVSLEMLNAKKLSDGNLMSGILIIKKPPANPNDDTVEETLEEKMEDSGTGLMTLELTTFNPNIPLEVQYVKISEDNYQYLNQLAEQCDEKILAIFAVPKIRLMIDNTTESMNSQKSNTIYEIYTKELNNNQIPFEIIINKFNKKYFDYTGLVDIETPIFSDKKELEVNNIITLFNNGLITLGEAINRVKILFPELKIEFNENNPLYQDRYYNGNPLGFNMNDTSEKSINEIGELIDYFKIN